MALNIMNNPSHICILPKILNAAPETPSTSFFFCKNKERQKSRRGLKFVKYWLGCTRNSNPYNKEMDGKIFS